MSDDIDYLIKFCSKEAYADDLLNGKLFMNAAGYYRSLELGQGDPMESAISSHSQIFTNSGRPIYCMYTVKESDILDGEALISEQVINDFGCANGWAVIIDYAAFVERLKTLDTGERPLAHNPVRYGYISDGLMNDLMTKRDCRNLFIKNPYFSHQKEYRIVVGANLPRRFCKKPLNGVMVNWEDTKQPFENVTYSFPKDIRDIARKIKISNHLDANGSLRVCL